MIKPATLWGLFKSCDNSQWIGDICRSLGGQAVTLEYGQQQMVNAIKLDSGWMDERLEAQRERWRERKRENRAKNGAEQNGGQCGTFGTLGTCLDETNETNETNETCPTLSNVSQCHVTSVHPSIRPSVRPESKDSLRECESVGAPARAGGVHPDLKTVVGAAPQMGVPEWYAQWWFDNCEASGWVKTNGSPIDNGNWRAVLKAWWNRADEKEKDRVQGERKRAQELAPRKLTAADWVLCEERCAMFADGRCHGGCIMPPDKRPHPIPPEECHSFSKGG